MYFGRSEHKLIKFMVNPPFDKALYFIKQKRLETMSLMFLWVCTMIFLYTILKCTFVFEMIKTIFPKGNPIASVFRTLSKVVNKVLEPFFIVAGFFLRLYL